MTPIKTLCKTLITVTLLLSSLVTTIAQAEQLLYAPILIAMNRVLPSDSALKISQLKQQLTKTQSNETAYAHLLMAKHYFDLKKHHQGLMHTEQSLAIIDDSAASGVLENALFIRAMISSVGLRKYPTAPALFEQVLENFPDDSHVSLQTLRAKTYEKLGSLHIFLKQPKRAKPFIIKAIEVSKMVQSADIEISARLDLAKYFLTQQDMQQAEAELMLTYKLSAAANNILHQKVLIQISRFYRQTKRYPLAIKYGERAIKATQQSQDIKQLAWAHNNLALVYEASGKLNMALVQYLNALHHAQAQKSIFIALTQHNIGSIYMKQDKLSDAQDYLQRANDIFRSMEHPYYLMQNNLSLGEVFIKRLQYQPAIEHLEKALTSAREHDDSETVNNARKQLVIAHIKIGNAKIANQLNQEIIDDLHQAVMRLERHQDKQQHTAEKQQKLKKLALDSEIQLSQLEQQLQQSQALSHRNICMLLAVIFIFTLSLLVCGWLIFSKKRRHQLLDNALVMTIPRLQTGEALTMSLNKFYRKEQLLVAIHLPLLVKLNHYFNQVQADQIYHQWIDNLISDIDSKLFSLNDATLICAVSAETEQSTTQLLNCLIEKIVKTTPLECHGLLNSEYGIYIGASTLTPFKAQPNDSEASNTLNLALVMLAGTESENLPDHHHRWLLAKPKMDSQNSIFNFSSRDEWVYSIKNNLIIVDSDRHHKITWDKIIPPQVVE